MQQLSAIIREKKQQFERLETQYSALVKTENMQNEFIEQFMLQK